MQTQMLGLAMELEILEAVEACMALELLLEVLAMVQESTTLDTIQEALDTMLEVLDTIQETLETMLDGVVKLGL